MTACQNRISTQKFTAREKEKEARRELSLRCRVYPRLVQIGKLTKEESERQIAIQQEIVDDYKAEADLLEGVSKLL